MTTWPDPPADQHEDDPADTRAGSDQSAISSLEPPLLPPVAGVGSRLASRLVDSAVVGLPVLVLYLALVGGAIGAHDDCDLSQWSSGLCDDDGERWSVIAGLALSFFAAWSLYVGVFEGFLGVTVGRLTAGNRLVDATTGEPIGPARALLRSLLSVGSFGALLLGFLWALWDPNRRTWHDLAVGSVVVRSPTSAYATRSR